MTIERPVATIGDEGVTMRVEMTAITPTVGVEITGMNAGHLLDPQVARAARAALDQHGVVVYREVHLTDEQLMTFSRRLGTMVVQPTGEHEHEEIQTITMDPAKTNAMLAS
jgi:alpha-ketoglutarate-dependent taurine dioxygenase